jgi:thiol reductant ABC exporter CydC subunit
MPEAPRPRRVLTELVRGLRPEAGRATLAIALGSAASLAAVALAASSAWLIDRAAERPGLTALTAAMCLVQFLAFSKAGLRYAERLRTHDLAFRMLGALRVRFFETLARLAPSGLGCERTGDVLSRSIDDVDRLQNLYLSVVPLSATAVATILASVTCAGLLLPWAALALAGGLLVNAVAVPALAHRLSARTAQRIAETRGELAAEVADVLAAGPELAASERLSPTLEHVAALDERMRIAQMRAARRRGGCQAVSVLVGGLTVVALLLLTAHGVRSGALPRVDAAVLPVLALAAFESLANLPEAFSRLPSDLEAGARLLTFEKRRTAVSEPLTPVLLGCGEHGFSFESATLRYGDASAPALDELSCAVAPGRRLGISGPSGSGKSSVAAALLRFAELESGRVRIDRTDNAAVASEEVRRVVSALTSDDHVFAGSIAANLAMARPGATDAELWRALDVVGLASVVARLPEGLSSSVGENACRLSGGERQRLCLARVLLRESSIVVLDEPTAHLDDATAAAVLDEALGALGDRTIVLMSHREDDLARMDVTASMDSGKLAVDTNESVAISPGLAGSASSRRRRQ